MYSLIRKILFCLSPETAHSLGLKGLQLAYRLGLTQFIKKAPPSPRVVMGLTFPNPIGLAAGLDVDAEYIDALASLGFGFIEVGGVTPKPQTGNPSPWLFRLTKQQAIINRKGFRNKGLNYTVSQLQKIKYRGILGVNIAKNRDTPPDQAIDDYLICFRALWPYISYLSINVSSPNTAGFRDMQKSDFLRPLLATLKQEQKTISDLHHKYVPLVVKISPDLSNNELNDMAQIFLEEKIDGVIATNTTIQRDGVEDSPFAKEAGGLSGKPLNTRSTQIIRQLHTLLQDKIPIIGLGGIMDEQSGREEYAAGASLLQIYTGLIYSGPDLIKRLSVI